MQNIKKQIIIPTLYFAILIGIFVGIKAMWQKGGATKTVSIVIVATFVIWLSFVISIGKAFTKSNKQSESQPIKLQTKE